MCTGNFTESGHGGQFKPCKEYNKLWAKYKELENKYEALQKKVERLKKQLQEEEDGLRFNATQELIDEKGPAKSYEIFVDGLELDENFQFHGWYRQDLEKPNWHYYESVDGAILHFRKDRMICVVEKEIKEASDE